MADDVEQKIEVPVIAPLSDGARREGQFTDTNKQGTWTKATEGYRASQKDSASMEALNDDDIERIKKHGYEKFELYDPETQAGGATVYERPARQAIEEIAPVTESMMTGPYDSLVKLNVQITNVPEVSGPVNPEELLQYANTTFEAGAQAVRPVENYMMQQNAVTDSLLQIGPALDNAVNYYANTSVDQVVRDAQAVLITVGEAIGSALDHALMPEERAKAAGTILPIFFFEGNAKEPIQPKTAQQLGLEGMTQSELSELGILRLTRRAGAGGDWTVINERLSPDVVQQARPEGCVAAVGEMLSGGKLNQAEIFPEVGTVPERLAAVLGPEWEGFTVRNKDTALEQLLGREKSWAAELRDEFAHRAKMGHMVVVDGLDEAGNLMIRDPQEATRYEMTREAFLNHWSGRTVGAGFKIRK